MPWYTVRDRCLWFISDLSDLLDIVLLHASYYKFLSAIAITFAITLWMWTSGLILNAVSIFYVYYVTLKLLHWSSLTRLIKNNAYSVGPIHPSIAVHYATVLYKIRAAFGASGTVTLSNNLIAFVYISFCLGRGKHNRGSGYKTCRIPILKWIIVHNQLQIAWSCAWNSSK